MALRKYTVTWAVEVEAIKPDDAARMARGELARQVEDHVFGGDSLTLTVTGEDGHTSRIDLSTDEKFSPAATEALR